VSTRRDLLRREPWRFGFLALMREFERSHPDRPRIGRNASLREETVTPGQDPWLDFPNAEISGYDESEGRAPRLRSRFLGYFGPQGALPLNTSHEVWQWYRARDDAFVRFADLFGTRFLQLFFRAFADARGITQFDHGADDRFRVWLGALVGLPEGLALSDPARLQAAGLALGRVKSPVRLRQLLEAVLGVAVEIEEHVPMWLEFEPGDRSRVGMQGATLGRDCRAGSRVESVNEKILIRIRCASRAEYESFLPGKANFARLTGLLFWYLGPGTEAGIAPTLPAGQVGGARLDGGAALGWTGWIAPPPPADEAEARRHVGHAVFAADHETRAAGGG